MHARVSFFRFYEELNDFLHEHKRKKTFPYHFSGTPSVKDAIEAIGVPHTEIDLILINGDSVDFTFRLQGGERVAVYPVFESLDVTPIQHLHPSPLRTTRFVLDVHLGTLCRLLRMLGFDSCYRNDLSDLEIISISIEQKRIILTRDQGILKHSSVTHGYWIRSTDPQRQIEEVVRRFDLCTSFAPFTRCMRCNGELSARLPEEVKRLVPGHVVQTADRFMQCSRCQRVYWRGTHTISMEQKIQRLRTLCQKE
ncbi:MAG: Mut7-C RNAse domain-containing protein [Chitinivibrionales bacterium]